MCVTFFLSFVTNPQSAPAQTGKVCEKEGGDEKGEREGRSVVLQCNAQCNFILFAAFLSYFVNAFHVIIQLNAVG